MAPFTTSRRHLVAAGAIAASALAARAAHAGEWFGGTVTVIGIVKAAATAKAIASARAP